MKANLHKEYSTNTLKQYKKEWLIDHICDLYYNIRVLEERIDRMTEINTKLVALLNENKIEWCVYNKGKYKVKEAKQ